MKEIFFILNSPYKWGKGWTFSIEAYKEEQQCATKIIEELGFTFKENAYDVPEGIKDNGDSCYMHPMEYAFKIKESDNEVVVFEKIQKIEEVVRKNLCRFSSITSIYTKDS